MCYRRWLKIICKNAVAVIRCMETAGTATFFTLGISHSLSTTVSTMRRRSYAFHQVCTPLIVVGDRDRDRIATCPGAWEDSAAVQTIPAAVQRAVSPSVLWLQLSLQRPPVAPYRRLYQQQQEHQQRVINLPIRPFGRPWERGAGTRRAPRRCTGTFQIGTRAP